MRKPSAKRQNKVNSGVGEQAAAAALVDEVMAFEEYKRDVLPMLRKAVKEGWTPEKIYKMGLSHLAAKTLTAALTETDPGKALAMTKEIMDRTLGKSVEHSNVTTRFEKLSDADLDRMLQAQEEALKEEKSSH